MNYAQQIGEASANAAGYGMRTIFLYAREADIDPANRRFKLGIARLNGLELTPADMRERSYGSLNDLCAALRLSVESPIEQEIEKLRRDLPSNFDFVMMVSEQEAKRLGFPLK